MKKILSMIMAVPVAVGMSVCSFAAGNADITQDSDNKSGSLNIDYDMDVSYTVTIPASVTFTDTEKNVQRGLQASGVVLGKDSALKIYVSSLNGFQMKNGDGYIDYYLMINNATIPEENNFNLLTVNAGEGGGWVIIDFVTELDKKNALYAGRYSDTLTFTVAVE